MLWTINIVKNKNNEHIGKNKKQTKILLAALCILYCNNDVIAIIYVGHSTRLRSQSEGQLIPRD